MTFHTCRNALVITGLCLASLVAQAGDGLVFGDLSESGSAFHFRAAEEVVNLRILDPLDTLEFELRGAEPGRPLRFRLFNAPYDAAPAFSHGAFHWETLPTRSIDGVLMFEVTPNYENFIVRLRAPAARSARYYNYARFQNYIAEIQNEPLAQVTQIGTSIQGRPLYRVLIDDPAYPPSLKKTVVMLVRQHGNEYGSSYLLEGTLDLLLGRAGLQPDPNLRRRVRWIVYPMINPDGAVANQRQNAHGIDLNRDWKRTGCSFSQTFETFATQCDLESLSAFWPIARGGDHHGWGSFQHGGYRYSFAAPPSGVTLPEYRESVKDTEVIAAHDPTQINWLENGGTTGMFRVEMFLSQGYLIHTAEYNGGISTEGEFHVKGQRWAEAMLDTLYAPTITDGQGVPRASFSLPDEVFVTVDEFDQNINPFAVETVTVAVLNNATGDREQITLVETDQDTGVFRNLLALPIVQTGGTPTPNDGTLEGSSGSFVIANYSDADYAPDRGFTFARVQ